MSGVKTWTLDVYKGDRWAQARVRVEMNPEPLSLSGGLVSPLLTLSIEASARGSFSTAAVELDARQAWSIGEHLRDAASAYLDAGGDDLDADDGGSA